MATPFRNTDEIDILYLVATGKSIRARVRMPLEHLETD